MARVDLSTARTVPWDGGVPFFLADFEDGRGGPLAVCPRSLLKKIVARAQDAGFTPKAGLEFEWFNFQETPQSLAEKHYVSPKPLTPGMFGYSLVRMANSRPFFNAMHGRAGRVRRAHRGTAHGDRARASSRRPSRPRTRWRRRTAACSSRRA